MWGGNWSAGSIHGGGPCQPGGSGGNPGGHVGGGPCQPGSGNGGPACHVGGGGATGSAGACPRSGGRSSCFAVGGRAFVNRCAIPVSGTGSIDGVKDCHGGNAICRAELGLSGSSCTAPSLDATDCSETVRSGLASCSGISRGPVVGLSVSNAYSPSTSECSRSVSTEVSSTDSNCCACRCNRWASIRATSWAALPSISSKAPRSGDGFGEVGGACCSLLASLRAGRISPESDRRRAAVA